ncbi:MAG: hypothetical protein HC865_03245 [Cyanobacteria bacterium RU_5_0]|nr:hypothetical protein [Cyanobacteria bacterium RU_5_0]
MFLSDHEPILARLNHFVIWLLPILGFGSIAYMLDGYFLGLTQGRILRQSSLMAAIIGFMPMATIAWYTHSNHLLWLSLSLLMLARGMTLSVQVPKTLATAGAETELP